MGSALSSHKHHHHEKPGQVGNEQERRHSQEAKAKPAIGQSAPAKTTSHQSAHRDAHPILSPVETVQSLSPIISDKPQIGADFPSMTEEPTKAQFPEEYTTETATGLVPASTIIEARREKMFEQQQQHKRAEEERHKR